MQNTVSIRLSDTKIAALNALADEKNRSRNMIMNEAIDYYLELNAAWEKGIEAAVAQADAGLAMPAQEVFSRVRSKFWTSN